MSDILALIMALPHPAILVGQDERIFAANIPAQRLVGADCTGWHYITALRQPVLLDAVEATLKGGDPRTVQYLGNAGARHSTWTVSLNVVQMSDTSTALLTFNDITAVEDAIEMRRDFVANVSHELRTPLTSLLGFIETLRGPAANDPAAHDRFLQIMEQETGRMHRLVEDLLSLSRVEGQERIRPTTMVDLQALIGEVLAALAPVADARGVTFDRDLPDKVVEIPADRGQMWQMIANLVENAVKYGAQDGKVTLRLTAPTQDPVLRQSGIRLSVSDEGVGIPNHHIARLTERFYRVDTHRNRDVAGTGLGLAICKHIINRHRGRLRIRSEQGEGTEFTVILPTDLDA